MNYIRDYIHRINRNDETLTHIIIGGLHRKTPRIATDANLALLMAALVNNPEAARRVIYISFMLNKNLSYINIPEVMTSLREVSFMYTNIISLSIPSTLIELRKLDFRPLGFVPGLNLNQLSLIAKITLNKFHINNPNVNVSSIDFNLEEFTSDRITKKTLQEHFQILLAHISNNMYNFKNTRNMLAQSKFVKLPSEHIDMAFEFLSGDLYRLESEITTLKNVFPEREHIISEFENSDEFKWIHHEYLVQQAKKIALEAKTAALEAQRNIPYFTRFMNWITEIVDNVKFFL